MYPRMLRFALAALAAVCVALSVPAQSGAQPAPVHAKTIILVHGAWGDGSHWDKVIPRLANKGYELIAVQLPLTSLADDVATVKRALALAEGPVLLVGHSYGGAVITEAGTDPKVAGLVYVAAFAPGAGQAVGALLGSVPPAPLGAEVKPDASGFLKMSKAGMDDDFAQDAKPRDKEVLFVTQHPTSVKCFGETVSTPAWQTKPAWYIVASEDRAIPPGLERTMAKTIKAQTTEVKSSHVAMLTQPGKVARVILNAAK